MPELLRIMLKNIRIRPGLKMPELSDRDISEYFHRSYKTVDGLWFVKTEELFNFNTALEIDTEVWKVMPKIQARFLKKKLNKDKGLDALCGCFSKKLELDGFEFEVEKSISEDESNGHVKFIISKCPWHEIIARSNRTHFSDKIGGVICKTEYGVWASEFGPGIKFEFGEKRICREDPCCILFFKIDKEK